MDPAALQIEGVFRLPSCRQPPPCAQFPLGLGRSGVHEVAEGSYGGRAAAAGFALAALEPGLSGAGLWVSQAGVAFDAGPPYAHARHRMQPGLRWLEARLKRPADVLWAVEEAIRSGAVRLVMAELETADFTATRRLVLAAARQCVPVVLLMPHTRTGVTAATARWRLLSRPSAPNPDDPRALGRTRWRAVLERSREAPGLAGHAFDLDYDDETLSLSVAAGVAAQPIAPDAARPADRRSPAGLRRVG